MRLRVKFSFWIMGLVTIIVVGVGSLMLISERQLLVKEINKQHEQVIQQMARVAIESYFQNDLILLNYIKTLKIERAFVSAYFADPKDKIKVHSNPLYIGRKPDRRQEAKKKYVALRESVRINNEPIGVVTILYSSKGIRDYLKSSLVVSLKRIAWVLLMALLLGYLGAWFLARSFVQPIQTLVRGMRAVSKGQLKPIKFSSRKDELGWMGHELNRTIEKLRESDDMKQNFFSRITHELRSPLIAIDGLVGMILRGMYGDVPHKQKELLLTAHNNASRLKRLVDDLLTNSRLEAKHETVDQSDFDVLHTVKGVTDLFLPLASEKGLDFKVVPKNQSLWVRADVEKVNHILINLLSNAFKFTKSGSVAIKVESNLADIQISVWDTGMGIPVDERRTIFNKFHRTEASKKIKGTGLGLNIVKDLVELQGGRIWMEENPDGGSVFLFTLPKMPQSALSVTSNR